MTPQRVGREPRPLRIEVGSEGDVSAGTEPHRATRHLPIRPRGGDDRDEKTGERYGGGGEPPAEADHLAATYSVMSLSHRV